MAECSKLERSLLGHEEYEAVRATHHPAIYELTGPELHEMRARLRGMRDKERTLARQKRREARGKAEPRGGSFPGTFEHPLRRKQVFATALRRVNKELGRTRKLEARAAHVEAARRALAQVRAHEFVHHPRADDAERTGMQALPNRRRRPRIAPSKVGRISQATKVAQAVRDTRGAAP